MRGPVFDVQRFTDNYSDNTVVSGTSGADGIYNKGDHVTIEGYGGADTLDNRGNYVKIYGGAGNDSIWNDNYQGGANNVQIYCGDGKDSVVNFGDYVTIFGGDGNDSIWNDDNGNGGNNVKLYGGDGKDEIISFSNTVQADGGNGDDYIGLQHRTRHATINGGAGDDELIAFGRYISVYGGSGNDFIYSGYAYQDGESVSGSGAHYNTIKGGAGNDSIRLNGAKNNVIQYAKGDGNDYIEGFNSDDTLVITGDTYTESTVGNDVRITVGSGVITLSGAKGKTIHIIGKGETIDPVPIPDDEGKNISNSDDDTVIKGTGYNDTINNSGYRVTIKAGAGNDIFHNDYGGDYSYIDGGAGADSLFSEYEDYSTLYGGKGNDTITGRYNRSYINGGSGNDRISIGGGYDPPNTIVGGTGDDTIYGYSNSGDIYRYASGDGYDKIYNYTSSDTIKFTSGYYKKSTKGSNVVLYSYSSSNSSSANGAITLVGAAKLSKLNIDGKKKTNPDEKIIVDGGNIMLTSYYDKKSFALSGNYKNAWNVNASEVKLGIEITGNSYGNKIIGGTQNDTIDGGEGNDMIYGRAGDDTIIGGKGSDTLTGGDGEDIFVYNKGDGNDLITDYTADDKISIKGDTVSSITKNRKNVIFTLGSAKKITVKGASDKIITYTAGGKTNTFLADVSKYVKFTSKSAVLKSTYPISSFMPINYSSYKNSLVTINASAVSHDLKIVGNDQANVILGGSQDDTINGGAGGDKIQGRDGNDLIYGGKGNDLLYGGIGKDTLWGGEGNDKLYGDDGSDEFWYTPGDGEDTIFGYTQGVDKIILDGGSISYYYPDDNNNVIFEIDDGRIVVNQGKDLTIPVCNSDGETIATYFRKNN